MLMAFAHMQKLGLLEDEPAKSKLGLKNWKAKCKALQLLHALPSEKALSNPADASDCNFIFPISGYTPATLRLVEALFCLRPALDINSHHPFIELNQSHKSLESKVRPAVAAKAGAGDTVLVFFVGGVTQAEIAALRHLSRTSGVNFIAAGTSVINGEVLVKTICSTPPWG